MSGIELYYCAKCKDHHEWDSEGQIDRCKDYKKPIIDFESVVKELATELMRRKHEQSIHLGINNGGNR
jgi:hypothetical protein